MLAFVQKIEKIHDLNSTCEKINEKIKTTNFIIFLHFSECLQFHENFKCI